MNIEDILKEAENRLGQDMLSLRETYLFEIALLGEQLEGLSEVAGATAILVSCEQLVKAYDQAVQTLQSEFNSRIEKVKNLQEQLNAELQNLLPTKLSAEESAEEVETSEAETVSETDSINEIVISEPVSVKPTSAESTEIALIESKPDIAESRESKTEINLPVLNLPTQEEFTPLSVRAILSDPSTSVEERTRLSELVARAEQTITCSKIYQLLELGEPELIALQKSFEHQMALPMTNKLASILDDLISIQSKTGVFYNLTRTDRNAIDRTVKQRDALLEGTASIRNDRLQRMVRIVLTEAREKWIQDNDEYRTQNLEAFLSEQGEKWDAFPVYILEKALLQEIRSARHSYAMNSAIPAMRKVISHYDKLKKVVDKELLEALEMSKKISWLIRMDSVYCQYGKLTPKQLRTVVLTIMEYASIAQTALPQALVLASDSPQEQLEGGTHEFVN